MTDLERLEEIKKRLASKQYLANAAADVQFLVELAEKLQKKIDLINQHNLELTQEMENMRSDFGGNR